MNEVKANDPALPSMEAKTEVDHLLEEPKDYSPLVDDVLSFNKDGIKRSGTKDSTFEVRHGMETGGDGMALYSTQCEDDLNLGALDGILDELEEVDIDFTNGLSGSCEDYFLDIDLAQEVSALGHGPCEGLRFGNSSSGSHSPGYSGSSNGAVGTSETSTVTTTPDMKCKDDDEKGAAERSRAMGSAREKRQRKPPQRYIEESSKPNSRQGHNQVSVVGKEKPPLWRQPKKKFTSLVEPEPEENDTTSESENEFSKRKSSKSVDRRKHQRMWTVQEVTKLIDGICEFGVGHWTDIKRLSFASAAYRTPIDLRDKWRNLLRASYAQKPDKGEAEQKSGGRPLPKSLLRRVRELSTLHPYPRKTKTRSSFFSKSS